MNNESKKSTLIKIAMIVSTLWGIGWTFYRHGRLEGGKAMDSWPYAIYRGVAAIWEEPKWKQEFDEKTELIGVILTGWTDSAGDEDGAKKILLQDIHKWLADVPQQERSALKNSANELALAMADYSLIYYRSLVDQTVLRKPSQIPEVQTRISNFEKVGRFKVAWKEFLKLMEDRILLHKENDNKLKGQQIGDRNLIFERFKLLNENRKSKILQLVNEVFETIP